MASFAREPRVSESTGQSERIYLAPVLRSLPSSSPWSLSSPWPVPALVDVHVRVETTATASFTGTSRRPRQTVVASPLSRHIHEILLDSGPNDNDGVWGLLGLNIQVGSWASQQYPSSPLDQYQHHVYPSKVAAGSFAGRQEKAGIFRGPSGVTVTAQYLIGAPNMTQASTAAAEEEAIRNQFCRLLQDLMARRIVAAPLGTTCSFEGRTRLHRIVTPIEYRTWRLDPGGEKDPDAANDSCRADSGPTTHLPFLQAEITVVLPTQGNAAVSAEGLQDFLNLAVSSAASTSPLLNPSRTARRSHPWAAHDDTSIISRDGVWGLGQDALAWSNRLLWNDLPTSPPYPHHVWGHGQPPPPPDHNTANNNNHHHHYYYYYQDYLGRRGLWMDWQASLGCHVPEYSAACRLWAQHGLQYTVTTPLSSTDSSSSSSSTHHHQQDVSLADVFPVASELQQLFKSPLSNSASLHLRLADPEPRDEHPVASLTAAWLPQGSSESNASSTMYHVGGSPWISFPWTMLEVKKPCLRLSLTHRDKTPQATAEINSVANQTKDTSSSSRPRAWWWSIQLSVQRPRGLGYAGTLQTILQNRQDENSRPVQVWVRQVLPPILQPQWQSLTATSYHHTPSISGEGFRILYSRNTIPAVPVRHMTTSSAVNQTKLSFLADGTAILEYSLVLAAQSLVVWSLDYEPAFLSLDKYPGDPNRGIELPPVRAFFRSGVDDPALVTTLYSNTALILPPLPDLSMPFNVLSLVCTLFGFVLVSLLNLLIRRASQTIKFRYDPTSRPVRVKDRVRAALQKIWSRPLVSD